MMDLSNQMALTKEGRIKRWRDRYKAEQRTSAFLIGLLAGAAIATVWEVIRR